MSDLLRRLRRPRAIPGAPGFDALLEAERDLRESANAIEELEDELAHAYWDSCGCLAGGMGHAKGSAECWAVTQSGRSE